MELISLDWLFGYSVGNRPDKINKLIKEIEKKYIETKNQTIFHYSNKVKENKKVKQNYEKYAGKFYDYLIKNYVTEPVIIEGIHISKYVKLNNLKGTIIIKRTSLLNSYKRAFNRDVLRKFKMYKNKEITKKEVRDKFFERIKPPLEDYIKINRFIREVVSINK